MATPAYTFPPLYTSPYTHIVALFFLFPLANSLYFQISRFGSGETTILYQGDAQPSVGAIELNYKYNYVCRVGRAIYADRVRLWDSSSGQLSDFTSHFSFIIDTQAKSQYGNGLAFFLAPAGSQIPPNSGGGFLGLFNTTTSDSHTTRTVHIEFDSYPNQEWDPSFEHVGINNDSIKSAVTAPWNASLHSGDTANAWITYNATTKNMSVVWSYEGNPNFRWNSSLSYQIDLREVLPEWVTIGFSAATGVNSERHILQSWEFSSSLEIKDKNGTHQMRKSWLILGLTIPILGFFIIGGVTYAVFLRKRSKIRRGTPEAMNLTSMNEDLERGAGPRRFSFRDLASATNNFSKERKLGEGGFGGVYRGYLNYLDMAVAVKKISRRSRQGKKEYITEVKVISRLRHRNLVQLIGWCHDNGEFLLVYEFMPNGSLDSHLFSKKKTLTWDVRYKIAHGLASALLYLHEEWEQCVVHRDIKPSNIMLDSSFTVKLGDFGLARLVDHEIGPETTVLAGTLGYLAPEYVSTRKASKESDVYSFGVVALEIASGRKSIDSMDGRDRIGLVEWVWELYGRGELVGAIDKRLSMDFDAKQFECLLSVGLWCAHPDRSLRPSIRQAIQALSFEVEVPNLPMKMPVPMYHVPSAPTVSCGGHVISLTSIEQGR